MPVSSVTHTQKSPEAQQNQEDSSSLLSRIYEAISRAIATLCEWVSYFLCCGFLRANVEDLSETLKNKPVQEPKIKEIPLPAEVKFTAGDTQESFTKKVLIHLGSKLLGLPEKNLEIQNARELGPYDLTSLKNFVYIFKMNTITALDNMVACLIKEKNKNNVHALLIKSNSIVETHYSYFRSDKRSIEDQVVNNSEFDEFIEYLEKTISIDQNKKLADQFTFQPLKFIKKA